MSPSPAGQRAGAADVPGRVRGRAAGGHLAQVHTVVVRVLNTAETWSHVARARGHLVGGLGGGHGAGAQPVPAETGEAG